MKKIVDDGGFFHRATEVFQLGITRRDWTAAMAMQGMMDAYLRLEVDDYDMGTLARDAYRMADAMIEEGQKR